MPDQVPPGEAVARVDVAGIPLAEAGETVLDDLLGQRFADSLGAHLPQQGLHPELAPLLAAALNAVADHRSIQRGQLQQTRDIFVPMQAKSLI